jgi:hypothetical protein
MYMKYVTIIYLHKSRKSMILKIGSNTVFGLLKYIYLFYREKCYMILRRWYFVCNYTINSPHYIRILIHSLH